MVALRYFLLSISIWMCNWHPELNVSETEFLIPLLNLFPSVFTPAVYGNAILSVAQAKNLGVIYTLLLFFCLFFYPPTSILWANLSKYIQNATTYFSPLVLLYLGPSHCHVSLLLFKSSPACFSWFHSCHLHCLFPIQQPDVSLFHSEPPGVPISLSLVCHALVQPY